MTSSFTPDPSLRGAARVARWLAEDVGPGDVTTEAIVPAEARAEAVWVAKSDGVVAGLDEALEVFRALDPELEWQPQTGEGAWVEAGTELVRFSGRARAVLTGERTALNLAQRMSGIATAARACVQAVEGTGVRILDTRKTVPGLRDLDKKAVAIGGGGNHRIGLYDAVMLKENHIRAFGSVAAAIERARALHPALPLIVEVETLAQLREALDTGCTRILIDDFDADTRREAVRIAKAAPYAGRIPLEVSGGVDLASLRGIADDGVDCISIGGLTKHVHAIDFSLKLGPPPTA